MSPTAVKDSLWLLEPSFLFSFCVAVLALSRPIEWVTSSSVVGSLEERNESVVDKPVDLTLHLGYCCTASHQWRRLNSDPIWFLYRCFVVLKIITVEVEVVERKHESRVLVRHWTGDRAVRDQRTRQEWDELTKLGCLEGHITFASRDSNCSTWRIVENGEKESENEMKYVWNELKTWGYL
jgi:hypothetical protein